MFDQLKSKTMTTNLQLPDEDRDALVRCLRRAIDEDRSPLAPRLRPIRAILDKLDPPTPRPAKPPPQKIIPPRQPRRRG